MGDTAQRFRSYGHHKVIILFRETAPREKTSVHLVQGTSVLQYPKHGICDSIVKDLSSCAQDLQAGSVLREHQRLAVRVPLEADVAQEVQAGRQGCHPTLEGCVAELDLPVLLLARVLQRGASLGDARGRSHRSALQPCHERAGSTILAVLVNEPLLW